MTECGSVCVSVLSDDLNCGSCGNACSGTQACAGGVCGCGAGQLECNGVCQDTASDPNNCGSCGNACQAPTTLCSGGACSGACASNLTQCDGRCIDVQGSPLNCGSCGNVCPFVGEVCSAGACRCRIGQDVCETGACQDVLSDTTNCGVCGTSCAQGQSCNAGVCECPAATDIVCNGVCVDPLTDAANCGTCGNTCGGATQCLFGGCVDPSSVTCSGGGGGRSQCVPGELDLNPLFYFFNNNPWGVQPGQPQTGSGSDCLNLTCALGDLIAWDLDFNWTGPPNTVKSYTSVVIGWHFGYRTVASTLSDLPLQFSANRSIECGWDFDVNAPGATYNVSYDMWVHNVPNPTFDTRPTNEIMIWLDRGGGAGPISQGLDGTTPQGDFTVNIPAGGPLWEVHRGVVIDNGQPLWTVTSYVRAQPATTAILDIKDFTDHMQGQGWLDSSAYLSSIQAGTETFIGTGTIATNGFYCRM